MSGMNRHRLPEQRVEAKSSPLVDALTLLVAFGMAIGLVLLLAAYVGVIS